VNKFPSTEENQLMDENLMSVQLVTICITPDLKSLASVVQALWSYYFYVLITYKHSNFYLH